MVRFKHLFCHRFYGDRMTSRALHLCFDLKSEGKVTTIRAGTVWLHEACCPPIFHGAVVIPDMLFFERILNSTQTHKEQRRASRYAVGSAFPLKAVLNLVGCDEFGEPLASSDGHGWNWSGRLV